MRGSCRTSFRIVAPSATNGYDANGNITAIIDTHGGDNFDSGRNFVYDDRDRMTSVTYRVQPNGPFYPSVTFAYAYDGLDNLRTYDSPVGTPFRDTTWQYDQNTWRLTRIYDNHNPSQNIISYQYDARGNATSRGAWGTQTFDLGNRMRSMTGSGVSATYDYDGHGRRTLIAEPSAPRRIQFYHQGGLLLSEIGINGSNTVTELKSYFYQGRNGVAERLRTASSDVTNYVHSDHLGSPMARSSAFGSVYERTMYEPYGLKGHSEPNPPYGSAGLFPDGLGFAGHRVDRVSGLSYMQQRYYDPVAGRFISMDPVTADSENLFNRYAYANNNPITLVDSDGRQAQIATPVLRRVIANAIGAKPREPSTVILPGPNVAGQSSTVAYTFKNGRIDYDSATVVLNEANENEQTQVATTDDGQSGTAGGSREPPEDPHGPTSREGGLNSQVHQFESFCPDVTSVRGYARSGPLRGPPTARSAAPEGAWRVATA